MIRSNQGRSHDEAKSSMHSYGILIAIHNQYERKGCQKQNTRYSLLSISAVNGDKEGLVVSNWPVSYGRSGSVFTTSGEIIWGSFHVIGDSFPAAHGKNVQTT